MTSSEFDRVDLTRAAAHLLDGAGSCTVALKDSTNPADVVTPFAHTRAGALLRVASVPQEGSALAETAVGRAVVVVIDEFAPGLFSGPAARVHVGSIHCRGVVVAARPLDHGVVDLDLDLGALAVSRLGASAVIDPQYLQDVSCDPVSGAAYDVAGEVLAKFAAELAAFCGRCVDSSERLDAPWKPIVLGVDAAGMDVLAQTRLGARVTRVPFREHAATADAAVREVARAVGAAA